MKMIKESLGKSCVFYCGQKFFLEEKRKWGFIFIFGVVGSDGVEGEVGVDVVGVDYGYFDVVLFYFSAQVVEEGLRCVFGGRICSVGGIEIGE